MLGARNRQSSAGAAGRAIFLCIIGVLAPACHGSLDLLLDDRDAAVKVARPEAGTADSGPSMPSRVPPNPCSADSDCASVHGVCAVDKGICVECAGNGDCSRQRQCDTSTNTCVECLAPGDCPSGWTCNSERGECALQCASRSDCPSLPPLICSPTRHICVECENDSDCHFPLTSALSLRCRLGICSECAIDADCPTERKYCDARSGFCEACRSSDDCSAGKTCTSPFPGTDFLKQCQ